MRLRCANRNTLRALFYTYEEMRKNCLLRATGHIRLAGTHSSLQRLLADGLVREDADEELARFRKCAAIRPASSVRAGTHALHGLEPELAEGNVVTLVALRGRTRRISLRYLDSSASTPCVTLRMLQIRTQTISDGHGPGRDRQLPSTRSRRPFPARTYPCRSSTSHRDVLVGS